MSVVRFNHEAWQYRHREGDTMPAIPWAAALYMFKKIMPVVIDQAPELLKTLERRRAASRAERPSDQGDALTAITERLDAQYDLLKTHSDLFLELQGALTSTRRSLARAWIMIGSSGLVSLVLLILPLTRP